MFQKHDYIFSFLETIKSIYKLLESIIIVGFFASIGFLFSSNNEIPLLIFGIIGGFLFILILVFDIFKLDIKIRNNIKIIKDLNILFGIVVTFNDVYIDSEKESELFKKLTRINSRKNSLKKSFHELSVI